VRHSRALSLLFAPEPFGRYDRLVARAARLNPPAPRGSPSAQGAPTAKVPKPARRKSPAPALAKRLPECREEVLRFMTDLSVPSTITGRSVTCG
jgi:hypothetical protein